MSARKSARSNNDDPIMNQPRSTFLSNPKWWIVSIALVIFISYVIQRRSIDEQKSTINERLFTTDELQSYTKDELYLAILGHVFNVSSAPRFYSSTGSYKFYTGRDASRSFHTGGTSDADLTDDLTGLEDEALAGIHHWLTFYQKQYQQIGKLIGRYFDAKGTPSEHFHNVILAVNRMKKKDEEKHNFERKWPPCNSEWSRDNGRRVWCTNKSGGIERDWAGVPRRYFDSSTKLERCVCVEKDNEQDGRFKRYENCSPTSFECQIAE